MRKLLLILVILASILTGTAYAATAAYTSWLFSSSQYTVLSHGPDWKLIDTQLHQSTGHMLLFWQNQVTGDVAIHLYRGTTGLGQCHEVTTQWPINCTSGAVIN